jgi:hypothetical protein
VIGSVPTRSQHAQTQAVVRIQKQSTKRRSYRSPCDRCAHSCPWLVLAVKFKELHFAVPLALANSMILLAAPPPRHPPRPGTRKNSPIRPLDAPTKTKILTRKPPPCDLAAANSVLLRRTSWSPFTEGAPFILPRIRRRPSCDPPMATGLQRAHGFDTSGHAPRAMHVHAVQGQ